MDSSRDTESPFPRALASLDELRSLYRQPSGLVKAKKQVGLDDVCTRFVVASPFLLLGTSSKAGPIEVSPRGGAPGWVKVLDDSRLVIPDLNGNNLIDSMTNILDNPYVGILFVHPGKDETLRVNGRAWLTVDASLLALCAEPIPDGRSPKTPKVAIGVQITDVFIHCAKAFRRGKVWNPESWSDLDPVDAVDILSCQLSLDIPKDQLLANFADAYAAELQADFE